MKKNILGLFLVSIFFCLVENGYSGAFGGNEQYRSSFTITGEQGAIIATGSIKAFLEVQSAGSYSRVELFDCLNGSTSSANMISYVDSTHDYQMEYYVKTGTSGLCYNNIGTTPAAIRIIWDWVGITPMGQEGTDKR